MAADIVPIRLSLTQGDLVTLWAPRWRENGEEWEAFLGDDVSLFAFPEVTQLAAFVRTATEHDLIDHPSWPLVVDLSVADLTPDDTHSYDIVGVPELAAGDLDTWTVSELAEVVEMVRSLGLVCELDAVIEVLNATPGFRLLRQGTVPFAGREGRRLWSELLDTISERWDEVIDALDRCVTTPEVDPAALAAAEKEAAALSGREDADEATSGHLAETDVEEPDETDEESAEPLAFWEGVGIDPIRITLPDAELYTLRCYVGDRPVFLGSEGKIYVFTEGRALVRWIVEHGSEGHDLAKVSTWPEVLERAATGDLEVVVDDINIYTLKGIDRDLAEGPLAVDASQLELAVELLTDVGDWAGDDEPRAAFAESEPLGWLVSFITKPDPTRLAPSPPFDAEVNRWRELVSELEQRLQTM